MQNQKYMIWSPENLEYLSTSTYVKKDSIFSFPNIITIEGNTYIEDAIDVFNFPSEDKFLTIEDIRDSKLNQILSR